MANTNLTGAKTAKNDEFYTQWQDIEREVQAYLEYEMDADHVTAWSKGGATDIENCQMLCKSHNRAKGNK
jgi:5-methylcytosine-specific restriction endonuclease McrA